MAMPMVDLKGVSLYYEECGAGSPVIFLHGFTLDRRMWRTQIDYFSKRFRVIVYDSRGHGKSSCPESGYSRADRVEDLRRFAHKLEINKFHLVGLSMGGATALGYAIDFPETLLSLVLVDTAAAGYKPPPRYTDLRDVAVEKGVEEAKRQWVKSALFYYANRNEKLRAELAEIISGHCGRLWLDPQRGKYPERDDVTLAAGIELPTLIFVGEKDSYFLPLARKLHDSVKDSEIDIVADVGHMLNMEVPERFNFRLEQFLDRVEKNE